MRQTRASSQLARVALFLHLFRTLRPDPAFDAAGNRQGSPAATAFAFVENVPTRRPDNLALTLDKPGENSRNNPVDHRPFFATAFRGQSDFARMRVQDPQIAIAPVIRVILPGKEFDEVSR